MDFVSKLHNLINSKNLNVDKKQTCVFSRFSVNSPNFTIEKYLGKFLELDFQILCSDFYFNR